MPRKLDRAPLKAEKDDPKPETTCSCPCKSEVDEKGKPQPEATQAGEFLADQLDIG